MAHLLAPWGREAVKGWLLHGVAGVKIAEGKLRMIRNEFRRVEKLLKDSSSMGSGGQGRRKEKQRIRGRLGSKKDTATVPRQRRQKACWVF